MGLFDGAFPQSGAGGGILPPWLADTLAELQRQGGSPMLPGDAQPPSGFAGLPMPTAIDGLPPASALPAFTPLPGFLLRSGDPGPSSSSQSSSSQSSSSQSWAPQSSSPQSSSPQSSSPQSWTSQSSSPESWTQKSWPPQSMPPPSMTPAWPGGASDAAQMRNAAQAGTYQALIDAGMPAPMARAAALDPQFLQTVAQAHFGGPTVAPGGEDMSLVKTGVNALMPLVKTGVNALMPLVKTGVNALMPLLSEDGRERPDAFTKDERERPDVAAGREHPRVSAERRDAI
jgi:hypothetical protein